MPASPRIACSTSAFKMPLDDALAEVARLGFKYVDLIAIPGWGHVSLPRLADDFETEAARIESLTGRHGLTPIAMNFALGNLHQRTDPAANADRLRQAEAAARLMCRLRISVASFYPGYLASDRPWQEVLADETETLREMLAAADAAGVAFAVELHRFTPFETVEQGARLLESVPDLRVAYDPSHYAMQGIPLPETRPFLERAVHVHLRDAAPDRMQAPVGQGTVDFAWIFRTLEEIGYSGAFSIEYLPGLEDGDVAAEILRMKERIERGVSPHG